MDYAIQVYFIVGLVWTFVSSCKLVGDGLTANIWVSNRGSSIKKSLMFKLVRD